MLKIGEFAALAQISIRMLRHYDDMGLLKPAQVDQESGYRYYTLEQLPRLHRILALKDLGLSLDEIRLLLDDALSADEIRGILKLKQVQLHQHIVAEQARLRRVENRLRAIELEGHFPDCEVVIKPQRALRILSMHGTGYPGHLYRETYAVLKQRNLTAHIRGMMTLYPTSLEFQRTGKRPETPFVEIAYIVDDAIHDAVSLPDGRAMQLQDIPAYPHVASLISTKPDSERAHDARVLWEWMLLHQYRLSASTREIYLKRPRDTETPLTELLFPIEPISQED